MSILDEARKKLAELGRGGATEQSILDRALELSGSSSDNPLNLMPNLKPGSVIEGLNGDKIRVDESLGDYLWRKPRDTFNSLKAGTLQVLANTALGVPAHWLGNAGAHEDDEPLGDNGIYAWGLRRQGLSEPEVQNALAAKRAEAGYTDNTPGVRASKWLLDKYNAAQDWIQQDYKRNVPNPDAWDEAVHGVGTTVGSYLAGLGAYAAGMPFGPVAAGLMGAAASGGLEAANEGADVLANAYKQGKYNEGLDAANKSFITNMGLNTALDFTAGRFNPLLSKINNPFLRWLAETGAETVNEAVMQEPMQGVIEGAATNTVNDGSGFWGNLWDETAKYPEYLKEVGPTTAASTLLSQMMFGGANYAVNKAQQRQQSQQINELQELIPQVAEELYNEQQAQRVNQQFNAQNEINEQEREYERNKREQAAMLERQHAEEARLEEQRKILADLQAVIPGQSGTASGVNTSGSFDFNGARVEYEPDGNSGRAVININGRKAGYYNYDNGTFNMQGKPYQSWSNDKRSEFKNAFSESLSSPASPEAAAAGEQAIDNDIETAAAEYARTEQEAEQRQNVQPEYDKAAAASEQADNNIETAALEYARTGQAPEIKEKASPQGVTADNAAQPEAADLSKNASQGAQAVKESEAPDVKAAALEYARTGKEPEPDHKPSAALSEAGKAQPIEAETNSVKSAEKAEKAEKIEKVESSENVKAAALNEARNEQNKKAVINTDNKTKQAKNRDIIRTAAGRTDTVTYKIVDGSKLITSNKPNGKINPDYPQELQPRDRTREASREQVNRIANDLDPELLGRNKMASDGAPIIGPDMVVESGNGRVMAIRKAYFIGFADDYVHWLHEHAADFGLSEADFKGIKEPVLVRVRDGKINRNIFVKEANEASISRMSQTEQAMSDADRITPKMLMKFDPDKEVYRNKDFIRDFAFSILGKNDRGEFMTKDGELSQDGLQRIQNALMALAYKDANTLNRLRESLDNDIKNVTGALLQAAPKIAYLENGINNGELKSELSIRDDVTKAASVLAQLKRDKQSVKDYLAQLSMFNDAEISPEAKTILKFFGDNARASRRMTNMLVRYTELVMDEGSPNQVSMFDMGKDKQELLREAIDYAEHPENYSDRSNKNDIDEDTYEQRTPREIDKDQLAEVYGDNPELKAVSESSEQYTRNIALGLDESANKVGELEKAINSNSKTKPDADLSIKDDILQAVKAYNAIKEAGFSVNASMQYIMNDNLKNLPELKDLKLSDTALRILGLFDKVKGSGAKIAAALNKYAELALENSGKSKQELLSKALKYLDAKDGYQLDLDAKRLEKRIAKILKDLNHKEIDEQTAKIYSQVIAENYKYFARATGLSIDDLINMRAFNFTADGIAKRGRGRPRKFDFKQQQIRDVIIEAANPRIVNSTNEAEELIRSLGILNTEINNSKLGITASISGKGLSKMMSDKAVKKSISPKLHALAVANIDRLFKSAVMEITHPDSHRRSEVNITHRLGSIMLDPDTGKYTPVMITVLEYQRDGNKIYTVEAVDVLKYKQNSAGQLTAPEQAGEQVPITEFIKKIANFAEDVNNGQEAYNQIIGEQGAARLDEYDRKNRIENLSIAREMEKIGKSADRIWLATGWERGADGKWRYEILDGEFHRNGLSKGQLDDFYDAPELYKAYPSLRGVHVVFKDNLPGGAYGVFDSDANTIELNENLSGEVAKHTIIHEIQHAVQGEEGFAHGGGLEIGDQIRSKSNIWAWRLILEYYAKKHPDIAGTTKLADVAIREYAEEMGKKAEDILTKDEMDKGLESYLSGRDDGGYEKSFRLVREENKVSGYDNPNDIKTYGLLAGEVEARNASSRMNMSEAERRLILLSETEDVAREDQIKIFGEDNRVARYNQIGKSRKAEMDAQLKKHRPDLSDEQRAQTIAEIEKLGEENAVKKSANGNPKLEKAALYWTLNDKRGIIRLPKDAHRIIQAFKISEKLHLQPEAIKDMNKFLEEHTTELASLAGRVDPDTVPQFSRKQVLPKGITVYTVEDTEAGQKAVRNIVNTHWGKDAQPWCITETDDKGDLTSDAKDFWTNKYNKTEKRIAFKNGKLLAFSANQTNDVIWTDRLNRETTSIPSLEVTADDLFNDGDTETKTPTFNDTALLDDLFGSDEETQNSSSTISDTTAFDDLFGDSSTTKTETNSSQEDDLSDLFFNQARIAEDNPDTRRGYIDFSEQGKAIIHILQSANKSTVIHETAHLFLQNFRDIVNNPEINLNEAARNDWNALTKWLGIDKIDFSKDLSESDKKLWRNAQEKFAAGAEKYFMDGKAPTSRLKRVFEIIKGWFKAIYEKAREITYVNADGHPVTFNISKDAREVYNHIYSGGENITPSWQSERAANLEVGEADPNEYLTAKKLKNNNFVETTDEADKAAAEAAKAEAAKTAAEAARPVNELGVYTDTESESDNNSDNMLFTNAETEARFRDSRGDIKIRESVRTYWKHIGLKSLGKSSKSGQNLIHAKGTLTRLVQRIGAAISTANNDMRKVIQDLTPDETELFMRKRIVDDLMWRISDKPDAKLPWGLDHETLKSDYERISRLAENNKNVMAAIKADEQAINELNNEMIELAEKLGMSDLSQVLRNPHYFHHEILFNDDLNAFAQANNSAIGTTNSKAEFTGIKSVDSLINTLKGRGYMKKYKGSERDMSSNYLAITADIRGQQLQDLAIMRALLELKERYDIGDKLRAKLNKNKADLSSETYSQDEINDNSYDGEIPEGYTRFDPEAHGLLSVNGSSKLDLLLSKGMEKGAKRLGLSDVAVGQIMKLMQDKENKIWIIPNEVADALKAFAEAKQPASFKKLLRKITKTWKMWQLFGPTQTLKYNLRNVTGDLDAVLAGNPNTLKYVGRAMQELAPVMFGKRAAEGDLKNYIERGADIGSEAAQYFNSGMDKQLILPIDPEFKAVSNELAGIKTAADFKKLSKKAFKLLNKYSIGGIMKLSSYRENILRYATYLSYLEQMQANTDGKPNNWGASLRDEIEAIPDIHDRAYKLSNELLGDYDSISELGMRLRDVTVPFYSWLEVNAKRYYRLLKNGIWDGNNKLDFSKGLLKGLALKSPLIAYHTGMTLLRLNMLSIAIKAFNELANWISGGADDDLPPEVKDRPHITFGYTSDGRVSYFDRVGAMLDILDWVGQDSKGMIPFYRDLRDILNGDMSVTDFVKQTSSAAFNKAFNSLTPLLKMPIEIATGRTFYPDATHPRLIRDMTSYIAQSFGLSREVNAILGEPGKPYFSTDRTLDLLRYTADPKEGAYFYILDRVRTFQERELGKTFDGGAITRRGQALRKLKTAIRYKDKPNQRRYLRQYYQLGGTKKGLNQSVQRMHPLTGLSKQERARFLRSLSPEDRKYLRKANVYFLELARSLGVKAKL